ncbi:tetratricopeptide repeat protein [Limoniibacter endophyticus]|uniref:Flp pilus assembly protein TadD n=1 Tax=Limoniibacter endophyticus TaxID=1565040 RepID=A0A8J3DGB8_9HYPH|nr:tetratricopeptide repeat protein [Limoniibacter endophyticus]GHC67174.1 hypothetical protein GCM10010136_10990 [Limoniibacter endophyticus]
MMRALMITTAIAFSIGLAGCTHDRRDPMTTGSIAPSGSDATNARSLAQIGQAYAKNPKDGRMAMRYASALQASGNANQSLAVMRKLAIDYPTDRTVLAEYGKALAAAGELNQALDAIRRSQTPEYPDWRLLSAEATILDQLGQVNEARVLYNKALTIKPGEPSVLSNMGVSYLLEGDLANSERYLKQAAQAPGVDPRIRQNLALAVGLQGRFQEAEQIAARDLPSQQAQANVAYLRSLLSQKNVWNDLRDQKTKAQ